jgi:hypothetical protein
MSQAHLGKRIKHALELSGMAADPNFTEQGSDKSTTLEILHLTIQGTLWLDWYAP